MQLPDGYGRIRLVDSFDELVATPFADGVNALCWRRDLAGDFDEVLAAVAAGDDIQTLDADRLLSLKETLSDAGQQAADVLVSDLQLLTGRGLAPVLDRIDAYPRDDAPVVPTDVFSFHADRAPVEADTYLCTYAGAASEGLRNEDALRHIDMPATRAALQAQCVAENGGDFDAWLRDNCYDLHYAARAGAAPFSFGRFNLWRIAIAWPDCPVPPCIHRAPDDPAPRLLLIS